MNSSRRKFLINLGQGAAVITIAVQFSGCNPYSSDSDDNSNNTMISCTNDGSHNHGCADFDPAAHTSLTVTLTGSHSHTVDLNSDNLNTLKTVGGEVTLTSSTTGHSHSVTFKRIG